MKKTKFEKNFGRYETTDPEYYAIVQEYKPRLKYLTILWLADRVYSDYIKITKSDDKGYCTCVTCGARARWDIPAMQNGHFHKRGDMKYRFMDENCYPQCMRCNVMLNGNYVIYTKFMAKQLWSYEKAVAMYEDNELKCINDGEKIELTKYRHKIIQFRKEKIKNHLQSIQK